MGSQPQVTSEPRLGRYVIDGQIAAGGMATVHLGRLVAAAGFERTVAIKRLHPQLAKDPQFASSFVDEARLAACIRHPNVASTLDVIVRDSEILVVMDYVHGESLSRLLRGLPRPAPLPIILSIASQMLSGLHAAHEARSPRGEPLNLVHRDVSPQNIVVGIDGVARVLDFGVAKASWRMQDTRDGSLKGKLAYMSPEQLEWRKLDRRSDIFAASVLLWEALTGERLFWGESTEDTVRKILAGGVPSPSSRTGSLPKNLDAIIDRGLARDASDRFATALEMAVAIEAVAPQATTREVGAWVAEVAKDSLAKRAQMVRALEQTTFESDDSAVPPQVRDALARAKSGEERTGTSPSSDGMIPAPEVTNSALSGPITAGARPRPRVWRRWGFAAGLAIVGIAAVAGFTRHRGSPETVPAPATPGPTANATPSEDTPAPPPPASTTIPEGVSAPAVSTETPPRKRPGGPQSPATRPAKAGAGCDPPYTVGPDGIRRYRPECI
jgi:serine/threonine protein kinase